jgi:hypothetical protein
LPHRLHGCALTARDQPPLTVGHERLELERLAMGIDSGTAIILAYVLVSIGLIIASLLAMLAIGRVVDRLRARRLRQRGAEDAHRDGH